MAENGSIIRFTSAVAYARKIEVAPRLVTLTGGHRGRMAKMELGYVIVEKKWYSTE
ncbi:MAG: hypothetical protein HYU39_01340 [Thaumarchaeota archaeon]|nr:hypothetical protein [Nitrososphaerota archaeon]